MREALLFKGCSQRCRWRLGVTRDAKAHRGQHLFEFAPRRNDHRRVKGIEILLLDGREPFGDLLQ
jgi:hypothetical protein